MEKSKVIQYATIEKVGQLKTNTKKLIIFFVPTFDTKVTEYLCSGWVFFSSDKFRIFN